MVDKTVDHTISSKQYDFAPPFEPHHQTLNKMNELRIYDIKTHIKVVLNEGRAEIFGAEMPLGEAIYFH